MPREVLERDALLSEARQLLVDGRLRVVGLWPRAADARVLELDGRVWWLRVRPRSWSCSCGASDRGGACPHVLALRLVVGRRPGPFEAVRA